MRRTALYEVHQALGARMIEFGGWEMPVQYGSIVEEHRAVRTKAGLFDLGHMGRLVLSGPARLSFLDAHVTTRLDDARVGDARYGLLTNERGTILDDVIAYVLPDFVLLVVNASNREKCLHWLASRLGAADCRIRDASEELAMIAIQGPESVAIVQPLTDVALSPMKYYTAAEGRFLGEEAIVARTGYTGEDGFEVYFPAAAAARGWNALLESGRPRGCAPVGLGARDTLRLEAAMPLYGHEITEETNPLEAGLAFAVKLDKPAAFVGREALREVKRAGVARRLRCIAVEGKRIPRQGAELYAPSGGARVGEVTSGTWSPTFEKAIAMGYVAAGSPCDAVGAELEVDIRGARARARVAERPFYKRAK